MKFIKTIAALGIILVANHIFATTWGESEIDDPILVSEKCSVHKPMSYGGYIYQWPSKYDQVFWPYVDKNGIWFCELSGFTGFIGDFNDISEEERALISGYLIKSYTGKKDIKSKLDLLENVYQLRNKDEEFRIRLKRILAYWYEQLDDIEKANDYRRVALTEIEEYLNKEISGYRKLEYLYLAANYNRQFGNISRSDKYLGMLLTAIHNLNDDKSKGFSEYLLGLIEDTKQIVPGGILSPEVHE